MNSIVTTYLVYLALSITLTLWGARTLIKNWRTFLVAGFYLINLGSVSLMRLVPA